MGSSATTASVTLFNFAHLLHKLRSPGCLWKTQPDLEINLGRTDMTHFQVRQEKAFKKRKKISTTSSDTRLVEYGGRGIGVSGEYFSYWCVLFLFVFKLRRSWYSKRKCSSFIRYCGGPRGVEEGGFYTLLSYLNFCLSFTGSLSDCDPVTYLSVFLWACAYCDFKVYKYHKLSL